MNKLIFIITVLFTFSTFADVWYDIDNQSAHLLERELKPGQLLLFYCEGCDHKFEIRIIKGLDIKESKTSHIVDIKPAFNLMIRSTLITAGKAKNGKIPKDFSCGATAEMLLERGMESKEEYYCSKNKEAIGYNYSYIIKPRNISWLPSSVKNQNTALDRYLTKYDFWRNHSKKPKVLNADHYKNLNKCLKELFAISC